MIFDPILPPERMAKAKADGAWTDRLMTDYLDAAVTRNPDGAAIVGLNSMTGRRDTLTYRQLQRAADRLALALVERGVQSGDVVSCQLPSWWQIAALYLACVRIGAGLNPLMPIFRHRELTFMLGFCEAKVLVVPREFRGFDFPRMIDEIRPELPKLEHLFVIESGDERDFERALLTRRLEDEPDAAAIFAERRPQPNEVTMLLYTSGTTGEPKGVMHTHNTLMHAGENLNIALALNETSSVFMPSPLAHVTGFIIGLVEPIQLGIKVALQDHWDAVVAAQLIQDERLTTTVSATPFLADLTNTPAVRDYDLSSLIRFHCGGAPIPRALVQQARDEMQMTVTSCWGMSEVCLVTTTTTDDPPEKSIQTDGRPVLGMEVRILDSDGRPVPTGEEGRLQARCHSLFVGYLKRPDAYAVDADGWFETGDLARMDEDGYIRITGRSKDIIIRGGENIPVVEVEQLLYHHPAVADAAIVAMPDERLGERGCCFITLQEGRQLTFIEMQAYLRDKQLSRSYMPERLEIIPEMPRTPSGKIQKFRLREMARELSVPAAAV